VWAGEETTAQTPIFFFRFTGALPAKENPVAF
jgi:hypothetical protein